MEIVRAQEIADFLGLELEGEDCEVGLPPPPESVRYDEHGVHLGNSAYVRSDRPRLMFGRILGRFFSVPTYVIPGEDVVVKPGAVIGQDGFGFEVNEDGVPERIPHVGGVVLGDNVEVGANTVIARGTVGATVMRDHVKLDDHVFIAHNVQIGRCTLVVAGAVICGSAKIGEGCWIGASACIREGVTVGDNAFVGMGSIVINDVLPNSVVVGNPAKHIRWRDDE